MIIDAHNIRGQGALAVVSRLLPEMLALLRGAKRSVTIEASAELAAMIGDSLNQPNVSISTWGSSVGGKFKRLCNYFMLNETRQSEHLVVLGDIPYRHSGDQTLFLQQSNLVSSLSNETGKRSLKFYLMRFILRRNLPYVSKIVVQTETMKKGLIDSYQIDDTKIIVARHEGCWSNKLECASERQNADTKLKILFYPASMYMHKNHKLIFESIPLMERSNLQVEIHLTIDKNDVPQRYRNSPIIRCLGKMSADKCRAHYLDVQGLVFPSFTESFGLPLVEAISWARLPVVAADRPYARELCGNLATYFDPCSPADLFRAIKNFTDSESGWISDKDLQTLPEFISWATMASIINTPSGY